MKSATVCETPVATTSSPPAPGSAIRTIGSTYSGAQPQSRRASRLPSTSPSALPLKTGTTCAEVRAVKTLALRRPATCQACAADLPVGTVAGWVSTARTVTCLPCLGVASVVITSTAGGSAQKEYERRSQRREDGIRQAHPRIGGLLLKLTDEPASTRVWAQGAAGERAVAAALDELAGPGLAVLHDRALRRPGGRMSKANVDHVVVAPSGDAKTHQGSLEVRRSGLLGLGKEELWIGGRNRTSLVAGLVTQMHAVRAAIPDVALPSARSARRSTPTRGPHERPEGARSVRHGLRTTRAGRPARPGR